MPITPLRLSTLYYAPLTLAAVLTCDDPAQVIRSDHNDREDASTSEDPLLLRCTSPRPLQTRDLVFSPSQSWQLTDQGHTIIPARCAHMTLERQDKHEVQTLRYLIALPPETDLTAWAEAFDDDLKEELFILTSTVLPTCLTGSLTLRAEWEPVSPLPSLPAWTDLQGTPISQAKFRQELRVGRQLACIGCQNIISENTATAPIILQQETFTVDKVQTENVRLLDQHDEPR